MQSLRQNKLQFSPNCSHSDVCSCQYINVRGSAEKRLLEIMLLLSLNDTFSNNAVYLYAEYGRFYHFCALYHKHPNTCTVVCLFLHVLYNIVNLHYMSSDKLLMQHAVINHNWITQIPVLLTITFKQIIAFLLKKHS